MWKEGPSGPFFYLQKDLHKAIKVVTLVKLGEPLIKLPQQTLT
jgi:hypothetical protein